MVDYQALYEALLGHHTEYVKMARARINRLEDDLYELRGYRGGTGPGFILVGENSYVGTDQP